MSSEQKCISPFESIHEAILYRCLPSTELLRTVMYFTLQGYPQSHCRCTSPSDEIDQVIAWIFPHAIGLCTVRGYGRAVVQVLRGQSLLIYRFAIISGLLTIPVGMHAMRNGEHSRSRGEFGRRSRCLAKCAHAGSRTRVTSMGGLYDTATLHAPCNSCGLAKYLGAVCVLATQRGLGEGAQLFESGRTPVDFPKTPSVIEKGTT